MFWKYCKRGVAAGTLAGLAYGLFVATVTNPLLAYMERLSDHGDDQTHTLFESTTAAVSVGGGVLWGIFLGTALAVAYYLLEPALPGRGKRKLYVLAGTGFFTLSVAPWLVLPPTAPGAEQALGTTPRILLYLGLIAGGVAVAALSISLANRVSTGRREHSVAAGLAPVLLVVSLVPQLTPTIVSAGDVPTSLFTAYQSLVVLSQASLWLLLAASYGWLLRWDQPETPIKNENPEFTRS
jgi:hypothetical protein